jgi:hypothetical protein
MIRAQDGERTTYQKLSQCLGRPTRYHPVTVTVPTSLNGFTTEKNDIIGIQIVVISRGAEPAIPGDGMNLHSSVMSTAIFSQVLLRSADKVVHLYSARKTETAI